jgi:hypothetical protein
VIEHLNGSQQEKGICYRRKLLFNDDINIGIPLLFFSLWFRTPTFDAELYQLANLDLLVLEQAGQRGRTPGPGTHRYSNNIIIQIRESALS